jgi:hypothetical protein
MDPHALPATEYVGHHAGSNQVSLATILFHACVGRTGRVPCFGKAETGLQWAICFRLFQNHGGLARGSAVVAFHVHQVFCVGEGLIQHVGTGPPLKLPNMAGPAPLFGVWCAAEPPDRG